MTVELAGTRMAAVFTWDESAIEGGAVSLIVGGEEKRVVANDGEAVLFFPINFSGSVDVTVRGSASGEETGTLEVVSPLFEQPPPPAESTDDTTGSEVDAGTTPENTPPPPTDSESEIPTDASSEVGEAPVDASGEPILPPEEGIATTPEGEDELDNPVTPA